MKREVNVEKARIVPATEVFLNRPDLENKFVMRATMTDADDRFDAGQRIRTSIIVDMDIHDRWVETMNTLYLVSSWE